MRRIVVSKRSKNDLNTRVACFSGRAVWAGNRLLAVELVGTESSVLRVISMIKAGCSVAFEPLTRSWAGGKTDYVYLSASRGEYVSVVRPVDDGQAKAVAFVLHKSAVSADPHHPFLLINIGPDGPISTEEAFLREWKRRYPVPVVDEWAAWVWSAVIARNAAQPLQVYQKPGGQLTAFWVDLPPDVLADIVTSGIRQGEIKLPDPEIRTDESIEGVNNAVEFLTRFKNSLAEHVRRRFPPLYTPGTERSPYLDHLRRPLLPAQEAAVMANAMTLRKYAASIMAGDMGTGKTAMAVAVPWVLYEGKPFRWLVMCPGHLVNFWADEIQKVLPAAQVDIVQDVGDLRRLVEARPWKPVGPEFVVISKEAAKLGSFKRPAVLFGYRPSALDGTVASTKADWLFGPICPHCGQVQTDSKGAPLTFDDWTSEKESNRKCQHCWEPLWTVGSPSRLAGRSLRRPPAWQDATRPVLYRYPVAEYLKRRLKGWAQGVILDEAHELKGDTAQGLAFGALSAACRYVLVLTGTLSNGYAADLHRILFRLRPELLKARGFGYEDGGHNRFARTFGRIERIRTAVDAEINRTSRGRKRKTVTRLRPGISPRVFGEFLMPLTTFLSIEDLGVELPPLDEQVELVEMEPQLVEAYQQFVDSMKAEVANLLHVGSGYVAAYVNAALYYPDMPFEFAPVKVAGKVIATPPLLPKDYNLRKVKRLAEICLEEKAHGRRCLVYATATKTRDVQPWLKEVLEHHGLRVSILYAASTPPEKRAEWFAEQVNGVDVVITNPKLVTGINLLDFQTIIWFQTGYDLFALRQASRRTWRLGQTKPVKVYFLAYRGTLQEKALQLMGSKLEAALALEGRFGMDGLRQLANEGDIIMALAKALVQGLDNHDSAEAIWRRMAAKAPFSSAACTSEPASAQAAETTDSAVPPEFITIPLSNRRRRNASTAKQLAFSFA